MWMVKQCSFKSLVSSFRLYPWRPDCLPTGHSDRLCSSVDNCGGSPHHLCQTKIQVRIICHSLDTFLRNCHGILGQSPFEQVHEQNISWMSPSETLFPFLLKFITNIFFQVRFECIISVLPPTLLIRTSRSRDRLDMQSLVQPQAQVNVWKFLPCTLRDNELLWSANHFYLKVSGFE